MDKAQRRPTQKRAFMTRDKILDGLESLLATREFESVAISDLAKEAGVAVGTVYSHFEDKDALLPALLDRQVERVQQRLDQLRETGTIDGIDLGGAELPDLYSSIELAIRAMLKQINQSIGVRRALFTYRRMNPHTNIPLAKTLAEQAFEEFVTQFELYRDEIAHDDLREAAKMVNYFLNILFLDRIVYVDSAIQEGMRPDDETLIKTYSDMVYHYLTKP